MTIAVCIRASQAVLLVGPQHDPHGASGPHSQPLHEAYGLPCGHAATAVVHCSLADVPRIDVASQHDDFVGQLSSTDLGDRITRRRIGQSLRLHLQSHEHALTPILHAVKHAGIFGRQRGVRDGWDGIGIRHAAGVRRLL